MPEEDIGKMAPKRRLRRPAAAPAMRRPAGNRPEEGRVEEPPKVLAKLTLEELQKLGFVVLRGAGYYGRQVDVAGRVTGLKVDAGQMFLQLKVTGTQDEALLRAVTGSPGQGFQVHVCDPSCGGVLTDALMVHGNEFKEASPRDEDWFTNIEMVVPVEPGPDELAALRQEAENPPPRGGEKDKSPKAKRKKEKKEEGKPSKTQKKEKKEEDLVSAGEEDDDEPGRKKLSHLYAGTGLDPNVKVRKKILRRAKRLGKGKRKKKKKKHSSSSSGSSSDSGSSDSEDEASMEGLFEPSKKLDQIWRKFPGTLTAQAVMEAKQRLLTTSGHLWSEDRKSLPPVFTAYARQTLLSGMGPAMGQETLSCCQTLDLLLQGKPASAADLVAQRIKSLESASRGSHWSVGRQMELVRMDTSGIAEDSEALAAARRAREEDKLKSLMSKPGGGKGAEGAPSYGGKGKKGRDGKGLGKAKSEESGKSKGGDGKKEEPWRKKEK